MKVFKNEIQRIQILGMDVVCIHTSLLKAGDNDVVKVLSHLIICMVNQWNSSAFPSEGNSFSPFTISVL